MDEQLIRKQTALLLDAYKELTGSMETPNIADFLKLREAAEATICKNNVCFKENFAPKRAENQETKKEKILPKQQEQSKVTKAQQENQTEKHKLNENKPTSSTFALLRSIQDPWNN